MRHDQEQQNESSISIFYNIYFIRETWSSYCIHLALKRWHGSMCLICSLQTIQNTVAVLPCPPLSYTHSLSLSLSLTHSISLSHTLTHSHTCTHTHSHQLSYIRFANNTTDSSSATNGMYSHTDTLSCHDKKMSKIFSRCLSLPLPSCRNRFQIFLFS